MCTVNDGRHASFSVSFGFNREKGNTSNAKKSGLLLLIFLFILIIIIIIFTKRISKYWLSLKSLAFYRYTSLPVDIPEAKLTRCRAVLPG